MNTENYQYTNLESYQDDIEETNDILENTLNTIEKLKEENKILNEEIDTLMLTINANMKSIDALISRIDKAIEYIKINKRKEYRNGRINEFYLELNENKMKELLNILNGGNENDN